MDIIFSDANWVAASADVAERRAQYCQADSCLTRRTERSEATPNGKAHFAQQNGG